MGEVGQDGDSTRGNKKRKRKTQDDISEKGREGRKFRRKKDVEDGRSGSCAGKYIKKTV